MRILMISCVGPATQKLQYGQIDKERLSQPNGQIKQFIDKSGNSAAAHRTPHRLWCLTGLKKASEKALFCDSLRRPESTAGVVADEARNL